MQCFSSLTILRHMDFSSKYPAQQCVKSTHFKAAKAEKHCSGTCRIHTTKTHHGNATPSGWGEVPESGTSAAAKPPAGFFAFRWRERARSGFYKPKWERKRRSHALQSLPGTTETGRRSSGPAHLLSPTPGSKG